MSDNCRTIVGQLWYAFFMARPRNQKTLIRTSFRLAESELLAIQDAADTLGISPSHFIRISAVSMTTANVRTYAAALSGFVEVSRENSGVVQKSPRQTQKIK